MHSELKLDFNGVSNSHSSTHGILMEELKKLRKKMRIIPFPFCELDCALISFCTRIQPLECIINLLREANQEVLVFNNKDTEVPYTWH
jgi:hypothetical protein